MPLAKQNIPLPLTRGIDKSTADQLRSPESLSEGINCEQLKTGEVTKRKGFESAATTTFSFSAQAFINNDRAPTAIGSSFTGTQKTGGIATTLLSNDTIQRNGGPSSPNVELISEVMPITNELSSVSVDSYACLVDQDFFYLFVDNLGICKYDRNLSFVDEFGTSSATISAADRFMFVRSGFYTSPGNQVNVYDVRLSSAVADYSNILSSTLGGTNLFDVCPLSGGNFAVVWDNGTNIQVHAYNSSFTSTGSVTIANTNLKCLSVFQQPNQSSFVVMVGRTNASALANRVELYRYSETPSLLGTYTLSGSSTVYEPYMLTGIELDGSNAQIFVEFDPSTGGTAGDVWERQVDTVTFASAFTGSPTTTITGGLQSVGLASKPFLPDGTNTTAFILLAHQSEDSARLQNCIYVVKSTQSGGLTINSRIQYGFNQDLISELSDMKVVPNVEAFSDGTLICGLFNKVQLNAINPSAASLNTYKMVALEMKIDPGYAGSKPAALGGNYYYAHGGIYSSSFERLFGFYHDLYPDPPTGTETTGGALTTTGTYSYVATYESYDEFGKLIESAPSSPFTITLTGSNNAVSVQVTGSDIPINKALVFVNLYRTQNGGSVYYISERFPATGPSVSFTDDRSDADIANSRILYTTGGVVENITPSNTYFIAQAKERLWTFERGSRNKLWFSKKPSLDRAPSFSDLFTVDISEDGGKLVGVAQLDDKILVFKEREVFVIFGDGPTDNLQGDFSEPSSIVDGMGCASVRSIQETPQGVFYESNEGIYVIDRGLNASFVGRPVYKESDGVIGSAYDPVLNRVFFLTSTSLWVFHITTGSWYEWTIPANVVDVSVLNGTAYLLKSDGEILRYSSAYQDDGANYAQTIKLGQFQFSGIQGYQRVYRMLCTGKDNGDAGSDTVTVNTFINSNTTATDTFTATHSDLILGNRFELEVRPSIQKCESLELQITTTSSTSGITLAVVSAEVGGYAGSGRRSSQARAT